MLKLQLFINWMSQHRPWLLTAIICPYLTVGAVVGWMYLTPYHTDEFERALDIAPLMFLFAGTVMVPPSLVASILSVFVCKLFSQNQGLGISLAIRTITYVTLVTTVYSLVTTWITSHSAILPERIFSAGELSAMLKESFCFWTVIIYPVTIICAVAFQCLDKYWPAKLNFSQKVILSIALASSLGLIVCPPWWAHDWVPEYREFYLGHRFFNNPPTDYVIGEHTLTTGICAAQFLLEFLFLWSITLVLLKLRLKKR